METPVCVSSFTVTMHSFSLNNVTWVIRNYCTNDSPCRICPMTTDEATILEDTVRILHICLVKESDSDTIMMVIILVVGVGGIFILFAILALCYRFIVNIYRMSFLYFSI